MSNTPKELEDILDMYFGTTTNQTHNDRILAVEAIQELLEQEYQRGRNDERSEEHTRVERICADWLIELEKGE